MKNISKKMVMAAGWAMCAPAALLAFSTSAQAAATGGTVSFFNDTAEDGSFSTSFQNNDVLTNPFSRSLDFVTTMAGLLSVDVTSTATSARNDLDFSSVFLTGTGIVGQLDLTPTLGSTDFRETLALAPFSTTGPGSYTLTIEGTPGTRTGAFGGTVAFSADRVPAVPEPATWGMMLLGFGAIGAAMRRRRTGQESRVRFNFA